MYFIFTQVEVERHYRDNPFHNFRHCFCVAQMMYVLIHSCQLTQYFSNLELCSLITACICHDLDHPGLNNTYVIIVIQHIMMDGPNHLGTSLMKDLRPTFSQNPTRQNACVSNPKFVILGVILDFSRKMLSNKYTNAKPLLMP